MFYPDGDCSEISWQFLGFSMPQWLVVIFAAYLLVFVIVAAGNLIKGAAATSSSLDPKREPMAPFLFLFIASRPHAQRAGSPSPCSANEVAACGCHHRNRPQAGQRAQQRPATRPTNKKGAIGSLLSCRARRCHAPSEVALLALLLAFTMPITMGNKETAMMPKMSRVKLWRTTGRLPKKWPA